MNKIVRKQARKLAGKPKWTAERARWLGFNYDSAGLVSASFQWECEGKPAAPEFMGCVDLEDGYCEELKKFEISEPRPKYTFECDCGWLHLDARDGFICNGCGKVFTPESVYRLMNRDLLDFEKED